MSHKRAVGCVPSFRKNSFSVICDCNAYEGLTALQPETRLWLLQRWVMQEPSITLTWSIKWCPDKWQCPRTLKLSSAPPLRHQFCISKMSGGIEELRKMWEKLMVLNTGWVSELPNETGQEGGDSNSSLSEWLECKQQRGTRRRWQGRDTGRFCVKKGPKGQHGQKGETPAMLETEKGSFLERRGNPIPMRMTDFWW